MSEHRSACAGPDGVARCPWGNEPQEYRRYHDQEWGRPAGDEVKIYEKLCLEGFQSGLSWLTILRKRDAFRVAFGGFEPDAVAAYGDDDVERLLGDTAIVRHRGKILAAIANARAVVALRDEGGSLASLLWSFAPEPLPAPRWLSEVPVSTPESAALSSALRRRGFRFVGPTTAYSAMQSLGVVDDHLEGCAARPAAEAERSLFAVARSADRGPARSADRRGWAAARAADAERER